MKPLSVSTGGTPGRLLMSWLFDRYRRPPRHVHSFFLFFSSFFFQSLVDDAAVLFCMCVCVCVRLKGREMRNEGAGQLIRTLFIIKGMRVVVFFPI